MRKKELISKIERLTSRVEDLEDTVREQADELRTYRSNHYVKITTTDRERQITAISEYYVGFIKAGIDELSASRLIEELIDRGIFKY